MKGRTSTTALTLLASLTLTACASLPPPSESSDGGPDSGVAIARAARLEGRLAIRVDTAPWEADRSFSAPFVLEGDARAGRLSLSSPVGTLAAQARWRPGLAEVETADGERRQHATLDALAEDLLGERLPLGALFHWLRGEPWPAAPSERRADGFGQLGWSIDTRRQADGLIVAERREPLPKITVRARLERGDAPPADPTAPR